MFAKTYFVLIFSTSIFAASFGETLFEGNCVTCHHKTKSISAPSTLELKKRYLKVFPKREEFVDYMAKWVHDPQENTSIMDDAIKKYGLMPQLAFPLDTTTEVSKYIYDTDFTK